MISINVLDTSLLFVLLLQLTVSTGHLVPIYEHLLAIQILATSLARVALVVVLLVVTCDECHPLAHGRHYGLPTPVALGSLVPAALCRHGQDGQAYLA